MLLDLLFPKFCCGCGCIGSYICRKCQSTIQYQTYDRCLYCEKRSYLGFTHPQCKRENGIDGILAICLYSGVIINVISQIKYRFATDIYKELFLTLDPSALFKYKKFYSLYAQSVLQAIPLHKKRKLARGFNQSDYIRSFFQNLLGYSEIHLLQRVRLTASQAQAGSRLSRYKNMQGAFSLRASEDKISDIPAVILIDDVVTTGSTVKEAARVLKKNGVQNVFVFSLAIR